MSQVIKVRPAAERRSPPGRAGQSRSDPRGTPPRAGRNSEEEITRVREIIIASMQRKEKQAGEKDEQRGRGRDKSEGEEGRRRQVKSRRATSEGGEQTGRLRWRINQLEKEKLELTSSHNQELCRLQAELARLRSSAERGEAQRVELQYQLTVSRRDADRVSELSRDKHTLTERAAELQLTVQELQKALDFTQRAREEDQQALQQEVEERDRLIQSFSSENQRLHQLLQDHEEALEESERRMAELQRKKEKEAEVNRRQASELKYLTDGEERSRREREASDQRVKSLESSIEAERAAHLECRFNSEVVQLRVRELEAALAAERAGRQEVQGGLELLRAQFREVERAYSLERERSSSTERALQRCQEEFEQCKSDLSVALETERKLTSDLTERLDEERRQHGDTHTQLEEAAQSRCHTEEAFVTCLTHMRATLEQHSSTGTHSAHTCPTPDTGSQSRPPAKDDGNQSLSAEVLQLLKTTLSCCQHRQETTNKQLQDLLLASEGLQDENQTLRQLTSDQSRQMEESQQVTVRLEEEVARLRQESSDWLMQSRGLRAELEKEKEEKMAELQKITDHYQKESEVRLSFLYSVYQRLLAGCVLLDQPQSILGNFTWKELCDVITEQVDQLMSDLRKANDKIAHLQSVCEKKSVCVRELQRNQECVLSRLEESVRRREEAWSSQHTHTVTQLQNELQVCRSQCDSLRGHASSLQLRCSSLTSDLSRLRDLLCRSRRESSSLLSACALLAGALKHAHLRLLTLRQQKTLVCRRLAEREVLEEEVRRLAAALGGDGDEEEEEVKGRRRRAVRRWRRSVCVVLAVRRWCTLARQTTVLFQLEVGGGALAVCVCGGSTTATRKGQDVPSTGKDDDGDDEGRQGACARLLRSKCLTSTVLSSMAYLQGVLAHRGSSPQDVMSASRSALSRLLGYLLDQSGTASSLSDCGPGEDTRLSSRMRLGPSRPTPPRPNVKALVSTLQQHFLLFSQRLHSAEVERRSLRLEVANLKRGLRQERQETVPAERFHSVCAELRQALSREQEAQMLLQEQSGQLHTLQLRVNAHTSQQADTQHTLRQTAQSLSEARQEASRKERSLRILGKHLSGVQREKKQLEERLQRVEDELRDASRRRDRLISNMKAAETSYKEVRESLVQSRRSPSAQPRPLPLPREHLELSGAESIMGAPEIAACQSLLSTVSQFCQMCSSRIDWLEQEVSAHRSHVTALQSELQDVCLRDNLAFVPVAEFPECFPFAAEETPQPVPLSELTKEPLAILSPTPSQTNPAPFQVNADPLSKPSGAKTKEKNTVKKNRGGRRQTDRK
uniref:coiled-coil domain-containing protein 171-like n=1 Tax=Scatophagus argus TaxID=75038 RepID=UPI001ED85B2D|nr:coiled-coil domain-containing protein 171-like [Scatophagus argus]